MRKRKTKRLASILALSVLAMALQGCIGEEELQDCNEEIAAFGPLHDTVSITLGLGRFRQETYEESIELQSPWWWLLGERNRKIERAYMTQSSLSSTSKYYHFRPNYEQPRDEIMIEYFLTGAATLRCQRQLFNYASLSSDLETWMTNDLIMVFARSEFGLNLELEPKPN